MADWDDRTRQSYGSVPRAGGDVASHTTFDAGLRKYMLSIYNYMTSAVFLTGIVALLTAQSGLAASFAGSPIMRTKRRGLVRNACVVAGNTGDRSLLEPLREVAQDEDEMLREHAEWAIARIEE